MSILNFILNITLNLIKRFFVRMFKSLISMYGPSVITVIYAIAQIKLFPNLPLWFIPLFFLLVVYIFPFYVKW